MRLNLFLDWENPIQPVPSEYDIIKSSVDYCLDQYEIVAIFRSYNKIIYIIFYVKIMSEKITILLYKT
jgi:hypothetical protein